MALKFLDRRCPFFRLFCLYYIVHSIYTGVIVGAAFREAQAVLSEETLAEKIASKYGEVIELSSTGRMSSCEPLDQNFHLFFLLSCVHAKTCGCHCNIARGNDSRSSGSSRTMSDRVGSINESDPNRKRGMVLPFQPLSIAFNNIRYAIDMPQVHDLCKGFQFATLLQEERH